MDRSAIRLECLKLCFRSGVSLNENLATAHALEEYIIDDKNAFKTIAEINVDNSKRRKVVEPTDITRKDL